MEAEVSATVSVAYSTIVVKAEKADARAELITILFAAPIKPSTRAVEVIVGDGVVLLIVRLN